MRKWICNLLMLGMILGCYRGHVALWNSDKTRVLKEFPYPVTVLPPMDQAALEEGISIGNEQELAQFLEDFLS